MTEEDKAFVDECERRTVEHNYCGECGRQFDDAEAAKLIQIIRSYEKMLAEGVVVYGWAYKNSMNDSHEDAQWMWTPEKDSKDTHRARLVQIEELKP